MPTRGFKWRCWALVQPALAWAEIALHPSVVETVPVPARDREEIHEPNTRPAPPGNTTACSWRIGSYGVEAVDSSGADSATTSSRLSRVARQWGDLAFTLMGSWR